MIELKNISLSFGEKLIFRDFSAQLPDEGVVLLSGESGIGKTTLLRILCGLQKPDLGAIVSDGETAKRLLSDLNMTGEMHLRARSLSGGQKQRVSLARAFAFSSDVVLLDEPFTGLDEQNKLRAVDLIRTARLAVVVTHDPDDAALLHADRNIQL